VFVSRLEREDGRERREQPIYAEERRRRWFGTVPPTSSLQECIKFDKHQQSLAL
jgi:hypothetical protein